MKTRGKLEPLYIPCRKWQSVSIDWIEGLPVSSRGMNSVLVVIDRFSKMTHLIATSRDTSSQQVAQLFLDNVVKLHDCQDLCIVIEIVD
jgi:hypothetical protein